MQGSIYSLKSYFIILYEKRIQFTPTPMCSIDTARLFGILCQKGSYTMQQVNFKVDPHLWETVKEVAAASKLSLSEVLRRALEALPLDQDGSLTAATVAVEKRAQETAVAELNSKVERQEAALREAARVLADLVRRLGGDVSSDSAAALARLDKMAEWAKGIELKLSDVGTLDLPKMYERVEQLEKVEPRGDVAERVEKLAEWAGLLEKRVATLEAQI
jgi:hypothetical protein